ncbi:MAG TPA: sigma-70 region 4 domain-containing protein [Luteimonas sp.]|nr:sigma-70 region 4 domain-containing protein [Luteimonas sp.]
MPRTLHEAASAPAALTAFLRGVERRGAVFAQLQVGDAATGDRALVAAMRAFRLPAAKIPFADWPRQFWTLLLATPELREQPAAPSWGSGFGFLGGIGRGPRAALLLRLVAGLPEVDAAAVLGVSRSTYRLALQRALPHGEDGQPDMQGWRMLGDAARHAVRDLSIERMGQLARIREAVVQGRRLDPPVAAARSGRSGDAQEPARWRQPAMIAVGAACLLAFAATFLPGFKAGIGGDLPEGIDVAPLPPADAPDAPLDPQSALLTHPDFELLAAGDSREPAARDPGFYAWLAAGAKVPELEDEPDTDAVPATDAVVDESEPTETEDAP